MEAERPDAPASQQVLVAPLLLSVGAVVLLFGARLAWPGCHGAYCSTLRSVAMCTDVSDMTECYALSIRAGVHLFELLPSLLAVGGALLALASLRRQALQPWALKAWRSAAAVQLGVLPLVLLNVLIDVGQRAYTAQGPRALLGSLLIAALAFKVPGRLGAKFWVPLAAISFVLVAVLDWTWVTVARALLA